MADRSADDAVAAGVGMSADSDHDAGDIGIDNADNVAGHLTPPPPGPTLQTLAESGGFAVDSEVTDQFERALVLARSALLDMQNRVGDVIRAYELGTSPGALVISAWDQQVGQRFHSAIGQLAGIYAACQDAFRQAAQNYQDNEDAVSRTLREQGDH